MSVKFSFIASLLVSLFVCACAASKDVPPGQVPMIVCHDGRRTLTLPEPAAVKHIDHGDKIGACTGK